MRIVFVISLIHNKLALSLFFFKQKSNVHSFLHLNMEKLQTAADYSKGNVTLIATTVTS